MQCSTCGVTIWVSHGAGREVLCKNCYENRESPPATYFQETPNKSDESRVKLEEASFEFDKIPLRPEESQVKLEEITFDFDGNPVKKGEAPQAPEDNPVNREQKPAIHEESPVEIGETPETSGESPVKVAETPAMPGEEQVQIEEAIAEQKSTQVNPNQAPLHNKSGLLIARSLSFLGWFLCCIAILVAFIPLSAGRETEQFSLGIGLGLLSCGLLFVLVGHASRFLSAVTRQFRTR